ncbi:50S ribosomal protein L25 [Buchnera aphidicola (Anoecia corni)]|uniref:Large ribosomal subunit protein bL25 n=1 Tax=Buchnera aphidicola (Anoecia corni) TaxID=2994477 RepID=A0AAT9IHW7_9GAMM
MKNYTFSVNAMYRKKRGTNNSRKIRLKNKFPSVIYGHEPRISIPITLDHDTVFHLQKNKNFYLKNIKIKINLDVYFVKIKNVQWHPFKQKLLHIDFIIINNNTII